MHEDLLESARRVSGIAARLAADTEAARQLPPELVAALRREGFMRLGVPAALDGGEAPPAVTLQVAEELARGDASTGWCVGIAATASLMSAYLEPEVGREILGSPDSVAAGVVAPRGRATPEPGGLRVSGRWPFCSGITHSDWLFAGALVASDDESAGSGGAPEVRLMAMPTRDLEILDTWHVSGLKGTGSHDVVASDVLVPRERTISLTTDQPVDGALYRFPLFGFLALSIAVPALGNARGAVEDLLALAAAKTPTGSQRTLAERPATQARIGEADAALRAAQLFFYDAVDRAWEAASSGEPISIELRRELRLAATHATRTSAQVVSSMYDLGGASSIYEGSPLQRRFRDAHVATAHFQVAPPTWELAGRLLLGLPTDTAQL
jgi:alkylation response protein AidB-like acyl-CoA dehydrogenase